MNDHRIKFSGQQMDTQTLYKSGERVIFQGSGEVAQEAHKPAGDGTDIVISTIRPLLVEVKLDGSDATPETKKEIAKPKVKSPSQRLRAVLWLLWEQQYKHKYPDFENYYLVSIEKLIDAIKTKLEEE